ncbi:MAG: phytanoyl-CoA dioxygenase family protein [Thiohalocapsa sp.]
MKSDATRRLASNPRLSGENARRSDVNQAWEQDNQAWWDWYLTLADDAGQPVDGFREIDPLPVMNLPNDAELASELRSRYPIGQIEREQFLVNGHIKLRGVLSPGAVLRLRNELVRLLEAAFETTLDHDASARFLSLEMVWLSNPLMREFVLSPRIARIAADLLDIPRVRLYHDNVLSKEPGCGRTPWHHDDQHFPLATQDVVTAWIPAQPIPTAMGPLAFAKPIGVHELVADIPFNKFDTSYDRRVAEAFRRNTVAVENGPFELGEVSFHHNLSFHTADPNRTRRSRIVLANTYFADGARVVDLPTMVSGDWEKFIPGIRPGEPAASALNPVCWPPEQAGMEHPPSESRPHV